MENLDSAQPMGEAMGETMGETMGEAMGSLAVKIWRRDRIAISAPVEVWFVGITATGEADPTHLYSGQIPPENSETTFTDLPSGSYGVRLTLPAAEADCRIYCVQGVEENETVSLRSGIETHVEFVLETPYTDIQFLGYLIYTGDRIGIDAMPASDASVEDTSGEEDDKQSLEKAWEDLEGRWNIMKSAIRRAYNESIVDRSASTLKVFMAPEFYFQGALGGYPVDFGRGLLALIQAELDQDEYRDWLFVLGTFAGYRQQGTEGAGVYNMAFVYKGGPYRPLRSDRWTARKFSTVIKATVAPDDYSEPSESGEEEPSQVTHFRRRVDHRARKVKMASPEFCQISKQVSEKLVLVGDGLLVLNLMAGVYERVRIDEDLHVLWEFFAKFEREWCVGDRYVWDWFAEQAIQETDQEMDQGTDKRAARGIQGGCLFKMDGIVFGLEICFDHNFERLKRYYACDAMPDEPQVQVQLIPSCGTNIQTSACVGPIVFNVDHSQVDLMIKSGNSWCQRFPLNVTPLPAPSFLPSPSSGKNSDQAFSMFFDPLNIVGVPGNTGDTACISQIIFPMEVFCGYGYQFVYSPQPIPPQTCVYKIV